MSGFRFRLADQYARAVEHDDIERNPGSFEHRGRSGPARLCDQFAQPRSQSRIGFPCEFQNVLSGVRTARLPAKLRRAARSEKQAGKPLVIDTPAFGVKIQQPLSKLCDFGKSPCDGDARDRVRLQIFQHAADEITHLDQSGVRQAMKTLNGALGSAARRAGDVLKSAGECNVNPAMDGVNPSGAREGDDNAGRSEHGEATHDPQARIESFLGQFLAAGDGNHNKNVREFCAIATSCVLYGTPDHLPGYRVDRGLARLNGEARLGHNANSLSGTENNPRARGAAANGGFHKDAMRDIRIIACILNDASGGARSIGFADRHGERRLSTARKLDLRYCGAFAGDQRLAGGADGGGGARSRGPASPQGQAWFVFRMFPAAAHRFSSFPRTL